MQMPQSFIDLKPNYNCKLTRLQCLNDVKTWMTANFLLLNSDRSTTVLMAIIGCCLLFVFLLLYCLLRMGNCTKVKIHYKLLGSLARLFRELVLHDI